MIIKYHSIYLRDLAIYGLIKNLNNNWDKLLLFDWEVIERNKNTLTELRIVCKHKKSQPISIEY